MTEELIAKLEALEALDEAVMECVLGDLINGQVIIADHRESAVAELQAEVERLREALRAIMDMPGEINPSNYDDHDVDALNNAHIETYNICKAALAQKEPVE